MSFAIGVALLQFGEREVEDRGGFVGSLGGLAGAIQCCALCPDRALTVESFHHRQYGSPKRTGWRCWGTQLTGFYGLRAFYSILLT